MTTPTYDLIVAGAGPTGLACAMEASRAGLRPLVVDKGCLCNSLYHYPTNMIFFTTPELMEIGGLPMTISGEKATRNEALKYYRKAAEHYALELRLYESVERIEPRDAAGFRVHTVTSRDVRQHYDATRVVIATGYYDLPNRLDVPGEDLPHVSHYYTEAHPCWGRDVVVIGGKNSAAEAALDLYRGGARVTLIHRRAELGATIKYWVRPDIENRIKAEQVTAMLATQVTRIEPGQVWVQPATGGNGERAVPAEFVLAMTGYHPDFEFLERQGIALDPLTRKPVYNPETHESNVPGLYLAGVIVGGTQTGEIFIENGRFHGGQIIRAITGSERLNF